MNIQRFNEGGVASYGYDDAGFSVAPVSIGWNFDPAGGWSGAGGTSIPLDTYRMFSSLPEFSSFSPTSWMAEDGARNFMGRPTTLSQLDTALRLPQDLRGPYIQNLGTTGGDIARGVGMGLGGLTLGLGALNALDQYRHRNDDRNIRNRQLALSEKAQNFAFDNAQRQVASGQAMTTAYNKAHAEAMKWKPAIVNGRQVYQHSETGQIALTRPRTETPIMAARGGLAQMTGERGAPQPSRPVSGPGTGQSDEIPALLSDGEYVIDASTVADLGDGSTKAGAKALDGMVKKVRTQKRGGLSQLPPKAKKPEQYMKKGK